MKKTLLASTLFGTLSLLAQDDPIFNWAKTAGGVGFDSAYAIASDASGNVYTAGSFNATVDFNPGTATLNLTQSGSGPGAFVQKLDNLGNLVWAKHIGGNQFNNFDKVKIAPNGDVVLAGVFNGTIDCDPNAGAYNLTSVPMADPVYSSQDVVVVRLTATGNLVWAKKFGGNNHENVEDFAFDASGNIVMTGYFQGTCDFDPSSANVALTATGSRDSYVLKLDAEGNFAWAKRFGGASELRLTSIEIDATGNIFALGNFFGAIDVDPSPNQLVLQPSAPDNFGQSSQDVVLLKLNASGDYQWAGKLGGSMSEASGGLAISADGIYVSGFFTGNSDMDPSAAENVLSASGGSALFLCKFDESGALQWAKQTQAGYAPEVRALKTMPGGDIAIAGVFSNSLSLSQDWTIASQGAQDMFVSRFDASGNVIWAHSFGGTSDDEIQCLDISANGVWHIGGSFKTTANLNPFETMGTFASNGSDDVFTLDLAPEALAVSNFGLGSAWAVYPNPSNGTVHLKFDELVFGAKLRVYTLLGQLVSESEIAGSQLQLNLNPGNYALKLENNVSSSTKKLIVY